MEKGKGIAALILAAGKPKKKSEAEEKEEGYEMSEGLVSAAEDAMSALKSEDPKAFAEALKNFVQMCE